jgi:hypothetical protein
LQLQSFRVRIMCALHDKWNALFKQNKT